MRSQQSVDVDLSQLWIAAKNRLSRLQREDSTVTVAANNLIARQRELSVLLAEIENEKKRIALTAAAPNTTPANATRNSDSQASQPPLADGANATGETYVGPRGGVYHYSKNGNKVYNRR